MDLISVCLFVISVCVGQLHAFNIDVKTAKVFQGTPGTGFGFSAEFIHLQSTGKTSLLVGAPKENVTDRTDCGIHYYCDLSADPPQCDRENTPPQTGITTRSGRFGEDQELFGLALTLADDRTAVACGPMWSDMQWWGQNYDFNIGRCQVLPVKGDERGQTPYRVSSKYIDDIELEGRSTRQMLYGRAEFGFSADGDGKGKVVIGAPGFSVSRGGVVVMDVPSLNITLMKTILDPEPDIVLGYAVAVGNFCGPKRFCFVASNRQVLGKVHLLELVGGSVFKPLLWLKGKQEYSSFGSAVCAVDVTGDGWADLLVGAPTFTLYSNDSRSYDQGRVFVYISKGEIFTGRENLLEGATLSGDKISFSRFGSAISSIGDINRDSINDIAVGAPTEEEGAGAVYVYLGSRDGPANSYSQKIRGKDFTPPLSSFGAHISKPTSALSAYNYPDFAVGAPVSSAAVFFKTRLIVNARGSLVATPNPVDKVNGLCTGVVGRGESGCVNVTLCLDFTYSTSGLAGSAASNFRSLDFNVTLEVDRLISTDGSRRVRIYDSADGTTKTTLHLPLTVTRTSPLCRTYVAVLKQDQINRNPFQPVELQARFKLDTRSFPDIAPMLNQSIPDTVTRQLRFKKQCGDDERCEADLSLTGDVQYVQPIDATYHFNVINHTKQVDLVLDVLNKGETSFGMKLTVTLTGHMDFWTATGNTSVLCDDMQHPVLNCRSWAPLGENEAVRIRLKFLADSVPLEPQNRLITFEVKVMPYDSVENPEMKAEDNVKNLTSRTAIVADVRLDGSSTPSVVYMTDSDQADVTLTHKLLVTNRGPSFLPPTPLTLSLPVRDSTDSDILLSANVTVKQKGGEVVECTQHLDAGSVVDASTTAGTVTTPSSLTSTTTPRSSGGGSEGSQTGSEVSGGSTTTGDPFGGGPDILPSRRRRRRESGDAQNAPAADPVDGRTRRMDCGSHRCRIYECPLTTLKAKEEAEVNVTVTLRRAAIAFPGNVDSLHFVTTTSVTEPKHALFFSWTEPRRREVSTQLKLVSGGGEINIWYIIGGIIGGLLLLILIGILAWRLGFFKREDKAKLEKLKRQSGFYDSNRSVKRKSQRATSSDSAPDNKE